MFSQRGTIPCRDVGEEGEVVGEGQGLLVVAAEVEGSQDGEGEEDTGGGLGLGVVVVAQKGKEVVYGAEGRYGLVQHSGLPFCISRQKIGGNLG